MLNCSRQCSGTAHRRAMSLVLLCLFLMTLCLGFAAPSLAAGTAAAARQCVVQAGKAVESADTAAFEKLVDYFKDRDEKAMIVMFGNQLPAIENKFYEELFGKKISNLDLPEECSEALKEYEILQYNNIFDKTNLVSDIE